MTLVYCSLMRASNGTLKHYLLKSDGTATSKFDACTCLDTKDDKFCGFIVLPMTWPMSKYSIQLYSNRNLTTAVDLIRFAPQKSPTFQHPNLPEIPLVHWKVCCASYTSSSLLRQCVATEASPWFKRKIAGAFPRASACVADHWSHCCGIVELGLLFLLGLVQNLWPTKLHDMILASIQFPDIKF